MINKFDVIVIGAGPAGMAAAVSAFDKGASVALIERDSDLGGILRQCIHDGFGLIRFKEALTGPEYAYRYKQMIQERNITVYKETFLRGIKKHDGGGYHLNFVNPEKGDFTLFASALVMAMGCRERTDRQIFIHGDRPAGIFTAGQAQNFINLKGQGCCKRCVILGSGDIGLIMARRLSLEGVDVAGVFEIQSSPGGLTRNIVQCLHDYNIPLELSSGVVKVHGKERVEAVTICKVDERLRPIPGSERKIECDSLILSVGLIPENDILDPISVSMDKRTRGPMVDQDFHTLNDGIFSCGNALHVNDLVDYVSESGELAGESAADYVKKGYLKQERKIIELKASGELLYQVPAVINPEGDKSCILYFRTRRPLKKAILEIKNDNKVVFSKKYQYLKPPEMERIILERDLFINKPEISLREVLE